MTFALLEPGFDLVLSGLIGEISRNCIHYRLIECGSRRFAARFNQVFKLAVDAVVIKAQRAGIDTRLTKIVKSRLGLCLIARVRIRFKSEHPRVHNLIETTCPRGRILQQGFCCLVTRQRVRSHLSKVTLQLIRFGQFCSHPGAFGGFGRLFGVIFCQSVFGLGELFLLCQNDDDYRTSSLGTVGGCIFGRCKFSKIFGRAIQILGDPMEHSDVVKIFS